MSTIAISTTKGRAVELGEGGSLLPINVRRFGVRFGRTGRKARLVLEIAGLDEGNQALLDGAEVRQR